MSKFGEFKFGDGTEYGSADWDANLKWTFIVNWTGEGYTGVNEAERMVDLRVRRGRQSLLDSGGLAPFGIGTATATFDNSDGRYDPWNTSSPLYPNVKPGKFVRIAVKDDSTVTNYGIMRGKIDDVVCLEQGNRQVTRISIVDGMSWLAGRNINIGLSQSIDKTVVVQEILDHAGWLGSVEWPQDVTSDTSELTYWWAWNQNAFKALNEFNQAEWAVAFHNRDGEFVWRPKDYAYERFLNIEEDEILTDIGRPNPWEVVRNVVRVTSSPKVLDPINAIIWNLQNVPAIADGETFYIEPLFKYEEWRPCGSSIAFGHTVNAEAGGGGADLTGDCPLTYNADIGEGAQITITNNSGSDGYITLLKATGDAVYAPDIDIREATDTTSIADNGARTLVLTSRWVEDTVLAQTLADWLLSEFKDPTTYPIVQIEDRAHAQFYPDLYDQVNLICPTLDIYHSFRVGQIEHQWLSPNGQAVRTTLRLEPYMQYGGETMVYAGTRTYLVTASQETASAVAEAIEFNAESHDVGEYHVTDVNPDRITIPTGKAGYYRIHAQIKWEADGGAAGLRILYVKKNAGAIAIDETVVDATNTSMVQITTSTHYLDVGDYVQVAAYQNSGGALDVEHGVGNTFFGVDYLGA